MLRNYIQIKKYFEFKTFVDLKNPIIVFKCDKEYIKQRLYLFSDLNESKPAVKQEDPKQAFIKMMQEPEADLFYSGDLKTRNKNDSANESTNESATELNQIEAGSDNDVKEYADTLTTWVYILFLFYFILPNWYLKMF